MQSKTFYLAAALAVLPAGAAFAEPAAPESASAPAAAGPDASTAPGPGEAATSSAAAGQSAASPEASTDKATTDKAPTAAANQADLKTGATVYDSAGATVGTIHSVTPTGAVVVSGKLRAEVPTASFAKSAQGLVIGITKSEFEAAVNRAKS